ncbi:MAG: aldo/keto reductase, partial [Anaerolineales bacterium]|nr:aldo/keto reductase [Anaerolineales bacterium]
MYRTLGRTGIKISPLVLGGDNYLNPTPADESERMILQALDAGINLLDTSNSYMRGASEQLIGDTLKKHGRRQQTLIATKVHYPVGDGPNDRGNSRLHIIQACEDSLRRLQTDYIDLYYMHCWDPLTPLEESLRTADDLMTAGKVRYIGVSNFKAWQLMKALGLSEQHGWHRFVAAQYQYSLVKRDIEYEFSDLCHSEGVGLTPWG